MNSFTNKECQDKNSACCKCRNKATVPSKFLIVDIALMALQGWDVVVKDNNTILSKQCNNNCIIKNSDRVDDEEVFLV